MDNKRQHQAEIPRAAAGPARDAAAQIRQGEDHALANRPPRLGELLVAQGKITQEQLAIALELQRTSGRRLGEELVKAGFVQRSVVSRALRIQRRIVFGAITTLAAATITPVSAAALRSQIAVSAVVPAQTVAQLLQNPSQITITAADIARGYVEVPTGTRLQVTSNNREGYAIDFFPRLPIFKSVRIITPAGSGQLGPDGGTVVERGQSGRNLRLDVSYRFDLTDQVTPGTYAWPLAMNVRPL